MKVSFILTCAGKGLRAGFDKNKLLIDVDGRTCLERNLDTILTSKLIDQIIITANEQDYDFITELSKDKATVVLGGNTRTDSVKNALQKVVGEIVLIHDGARPYVTKKMIADCIATAREKDSAVPVIPCRDTILKSEGDFASDYVGKSGLYMVQTPQGFKTELIKRAYARAGDKTFNDDGEVYKQYIGKLALYDGDDKNVKLTFREDFSFEPQYRFGTGFDCHKLVENRKLILGGIEIPHDKGLLGHSDADVLTHAVMDAILSALALRDIGYHFSDKDPKYKDADSMQLLKTVLEMVDKKGYKISSISATIMAEKPKLLQHIPNITQNLSTALSIPKEMIGIGATTLEGLGFVGREEGICVHATATAVKQ